MKKLIFFLVITLVVFYTNDKANNLKILDKTYNNISKLFHVDPFTNCLTNYCIFEIKLKPHNATNPSKTWKLIDSMKQNYWLYERDALRYGICIKNQTDFVELEKYLPNFESHQISTEVLNVECRHFPKNLNFTVYDFFFYSGLFIWIYLQFKSATLDQTKIGRFLKPFSIKNNLRLIAKMWNASKKLKAIESLRFFTMVLIIVNHTYGGRSCSFLENINYFENFCVEPFKRELATLFSFLVTIFFLLSGWLLAYNSFLHFSINPNVSFWKYFSITAINRYLRLIPHLLFIFAVTMTSFYKYYFYGPLDYLVVMPEIRNCRNNYWISFLFLQNHYKSGEICNSVSWYLAADFQLYVLSLIVLFVVHKLNHRLRINVLLILIFAGVLLQAFIIYFNDSDIIFRMCGSKFRQLRMSDFDFQTLYVGTYVNFSAYMVGLLFGYIFFFYEFKQLNKKIISNLMNCFAIVPISIIFLSSHQYPRYLAPFIGGLNNPVCAFGIGCGLLALLKGYQGFVSKVFEFKLFVFLGNITYCTFMFHNFPIHKKIIANEKLLRMSDSYLITAVIIDTITSFIISFVFYILLELPCSQLQSIIIPKLKKDKQDKICSSFDIIIET